MEDPTPAVCSRCGGSLPAAQTVCSACAAGTKQAVEPKKKKNPWEVEVAVWLLAGAMTLSLLRWNLFGVALSLVPALGLQAGRALIRGLTTAVLVVGGGAKCYLFFKSREDHHLYVAGFWFFVAGLMIFCWLRGGFGLATEARRHGEDDQVS